MVREQGSEGHAVTTRVQAKARETSDPASFNLYKWLIISWMMSLGKYSRRVS